MSANTGGWGFPMFIVGLLIGMIFTGLIDQFVSHSLEVTKTQREAIQHGRACYAPDADWYPTFSWECPISERAK